ncbi:hypothetical protein HH308_07310 [Gordonia sp. TBRC 11910]|uniref:Hsp70 protein n=1 Tax=Gordonia asplenii TaxID=2725283 RepID=A0A848KXT8_9ACTN|nr:hypothetical protein [Gordonia asplenii]NMO01021.1 hypothetical protein [Gordonia asplenii]
MGQPISSPELLTTEVTDVSATLGVSAGRGMIHVARLGIDSAGRSTVESRVLDVEPADGLNQASRVNSAIDVMRTATADTAASSICVAVRSDDEYTELHRGTGSRRRVRVVDENAATVRYLSDAGLLSSYDSVLVVDCGDSGMTLFTTTSGEDVTDVVRVPDLSGQELDRRLATAIGPAHGWSKRPTDEQVAACRTAKEELFSVEARPASGQVQVTDADVELAAEPLIDAAAQQVSKYVRRRDARPQVVVVVGGLANIAHIVDGIGRAADVAAMAAPMPELAGALGAALIARETDSGITRLVTIGGRRNRDWLSTAPLVVAGAAIGVIAMSVYASGALTNHESPFIPATPSSPNISDASILTTRTPVDNDYGEATLTPETTETGTGPGGWATTRLDPTTPARTRTLVPTTLPPTTSTTPTKSPDASSSDSSTPSSAPRIPFVPSGIPLPPNLIPSGLIPSPSPAPQPQNAPAGEQTTPAPKQTPRSVAPAARSGTRHAPPHSTPEPPEVPQR